MEAYRLSSKLRDQDHEYLIQTANDRNLGAIATTIYVDGVLTETVHCPHPADAGKDTVLSLVKETHSEKKQEIETLLQSCRAALQTAQPAVAYRLATSLYYRGFCREARELVLNAVRKRSELHQAYNLLGMCELALGNIEAAIGAASKAVSLRPDFADYRNNLGEAFLANGASTQAIEQFEAAIGINLYYADAYFNRGLALLLTTGMPTAPKGEALLTQAADAVRKACLIQPAYGGPEFDAGMAAMKERNAGRALQVFKSIQKRQKECRRQELAALYARLPLESELPSAKELEGRISYLKGEIARNPLYPDLQAELAQCYIDQARLACQKATDHFKKAITLNPSLSQNHICHDQMQDVLERLNTVAGRIGEQD